MFLQRWGRTRPHTKEGGQEEGEDRGGGEEEEGGKEGFLLLLGFLTATLEAR